ncbi:DeoR/GlpR family DNA-binding transcription regulator [Curtobacterium ammoniigenes]|uniref:DeoR/GlpR family DNA-binding transcription regulator n=1 Tax=Curtobacterium ammoniigenes TaxID=395387 RepID=UPI00082C734B|nr:DeoR/GlpR family DNA-binding transcription regulator [Curtobacterium ammoniigenes]
MTARERRQEIGSLLRQAPIGVDDLASRFGVTASTIRRDLETLAQSGAIVRTYGGARAVGAHEQSLREREQIAIHQKAAIGRLASALIPASALIVLDAGTTAGALARCIAHREDLTVVTNGLTTTRELEHSTGIDLVVLGGSLRHISSGLVGPIAERTMSGITADIAFLSADGVSADRGLCEQTPEQAALKRIMVENAQRVYVLADATKLGAETSHWWTAIEQPWTLITDSGADDAQLTRFREAGVEVMVAPPA